MDDRSIMFIAEQYLSVCISESKSIYKSMVYKLLLLASPQWGAADAEIKVSFVENTQLKRSLFKA